ncbi:hypothetical protein Bca52824_007329 [Brassica carinata]|uniref:Uncharacterized protein n=1 Tax=Brassica carinata TaxID=52824 RepID=A0A8X7W7B7_BRACI|nr:hypothetical protein Bca52824_007329 [Brassica carinata]
MESSSAVSPATSSAEPHFLYLIASSSPSVRSNLHLRRDPHAGDHSRTSFDYDATVHDYGFASDSMNIDRKSNGDRNSINNGGGRKSSADDVWKEIVSGEEEKKTCNRKTVYL